MGDSDRSTATDAATPEEVKDHLWGLRDRALYRAQLSALYHRRREHFFDTCDKAALFLALFAGSAAFGMAATPTAVKIAAVVVACSTALSLVFSVGGKARRHATLAERFKHIEAEIKLVGDYDYTEKQVNKWQSDIARLEANELPDRPILIRLCQNRIAQSEGHTDMVKPVTFSERLFAQFSSTVPAP